MQIALILKLYRHHSDQVVHVCMFCVKIFHFKKLLRSAGKTGVREMKLKFSELKEFVRPVQNALNALPAALKVVATCS